MYPYTPRYDDELFSDFSIQEEPMKTVQQPLAYIFDPSGLSVFVHGKSHTIRNDHPNYSKIVDALRDKRYDELGDLLDVAKAIKSYASGKVEVRDGEVFYAGEVLHTTLTNRLLDMMSEGFDIKPLVNFLSNLMENPSRTAVEELYLFLESGKLPITEDGHFLAYKKVREDFRDIHSGRFSNAPGQVLEMARNQVDDKRDNTCSTGFHFCSIAYLPQFSSNSTSDRVVIVKINPRDVVSIPSDYNNTKGRACRYEVVGEYTGDWDRGEVAWDSPVADEYEDTDDYAPVQRPVSPRTMPLRDPETGRFVKTGTSRWYELKDEGY
jgi:hypothetical protein